MAYFVAEEQTKLDLSGHAIWLDHDRQLLQVSASNLWAELGREIGLDSGAVMSLAVKTRLLYFKYVHPFESSQASADDPSGSSSIPLAEGAAFQEDRPTDLPGQVQPFGLATASTFVTSDSRETSQISEALPKVVDVESFREAADAQPVCGAHQLEGDVY